MMKIQSYSKQQLSASHEAFVAEGKEKFEENALLRSREHPGSAVEEDLLSFSKAAVEHARELEKAFDSPMKSWREMAFIARKVAQIMFRENGEKSDNKEFLRLVK